MKQIRLNTTLDNFFRQAWDLYEDAFPAEERRLLETQVGVMKNHDYHFDVMIDGGQLIGFLLWWDFEKHRYIDHFATSKQLRNQGLGRSILEKFIDRSDKPILLEVELPNSTIDQRRIKFYERIGFELNQHYYEVPTSTENESPLQLLLMSYPTPISIIEVEEFKEIYHPIIFKD